MTAQIVMQAEIQHTGFASSRDATYKDFVGTKQAIKTENVNKHVKQ